MTEFPVRKTFIDFHAPLPRTRSASAPPCSSVISDQISLRGTNQRKVKQSVASPAEEDQAVIEKYRSKSIGETWMHLVDSLSDQRIRNALSQSNFLPSRNKMTLPGTLSGGSCASEYASPAPPTLKAPLVYNLSADDKEKLQAFIHRTNFEMPICMADLYVFTSVRPHCYWCPALAGPKDEYEKRNTCDRPCQKACTTARVRIPISLLQNNDHRPKRTRPTPNITPIDNLVRDLFVLALYSRHSRCSCCEHDPQSWMGCDGQTKNTC